MLLIHGESPPIRTTASPTSNQQKKKNDLAHLSIAFVSFKCKLICLTILINAHTQRQPTKKQNHPENRAYATQQKQREEKTEIEIKETINTKKNTHTRNEKKKVKQKQVK